MRIVRQVDDIPRNAGSMKSSIPSIPVEVFLEVLCAVHLSSYVQGGVPDRSGLMIVGPPGVMKSSFMDVLDLYSEAIKLSDVNVQTLVAMRDQLSNNSIRTLVIPEFAKLYERDPRTAANVEGTLRALAAEGFSAASFEDSRVSRFHARACIVAALTPALQSVQFRRWEDTGFARRFLWALIRLKDPRVLDRAVEQWKTIPLRRGGRLIPDMDSGIPNLTTPAMRASLKHFLKYQPGGVHATQFAMLVKMLAVLTWHYKKRKIRRNALDTITQFAPCLSRGGAEIEL